MANNFTIALHANPAPTGNFTLRLSDPVTNVDILIIWIGEEAWA
jgi:hypothetical protein